MDGGRKAEACSVGQAMNIARRGLEQIRLTVMGEISEISAKRNYAAVYFTIRDEDAVMPCIMWRNVYDACGMELEIGDLIQVSGRFSCYPAKGNLQFSVERVAQVGEGDLRLKVARIAKKLNREGLMDGSRKRRVPALPKRIGVITSPNGKAIRDVMRTLRRRYPMGELMVYGVQVEGVHAPQNMIKALEVAQMSDPAPEVILLVRGGGTYEALMPYNDEALARAIAACTIPIVSGIGHEPDNSIADMVADVRCSTPTAAAESIAPSTQELMGKVNNARRALENAYDMRIQALYHRLGRVIDRPIWRDHNAVLGNYAQALDMAQERLSHALPGAFQDNDAQLRMLGEKLTRALPANLLVHARALEDSRKALDDALKINTTACAAKVSELQSGLQHAGSAVLQEPRKQLALGAAKLDALSPLKTLSRGYSIAYAQDGASIIKCASDASAGDKISVRVQDGSLDCTVDAVKSTA